MYFKKLLFLVFAYWAFVPLSFATFSPSPCLVVGNYNFTDCSANLIVLIAAVPDNSHTTTFRQVNGSSGYTPSGANKFRVKAVSCASSGTPAAQQCNIYQTDNDLGYNNVSAGTNPVYPGGNINMGYFIDARGIGGTPPAGERAFGDKGGFLLANGKYLTFIVNSAVQTSALVYGYEE